MKMILNEYRLMPWQKEAQDLVAKHMEDFFFGEGAALPPGYVPRTGEVGCPGGTSSFQAGRRLSPGARFPERSIRLMPGSL